MNDMNLMRDENGKWWVTNSRNKPIVEFAYSDEAEFAYQLGIERRHNETLDVTSAILKSKLDL